LDSHIDEQSNTSGILDEITTDESLVSRIEEREKLFFLNNCCNFSPLVEGWVDTCGVMGTGMEEHDRSLINE
jgi:hypothetical protein